jgi:hypothetical protein
MNLDRVVMHVSSTADQGVVGPGTCLRFVQKGSRVMGRYNGGPSRGAAWWARSRDHNSFFGMCKSRHPARYTGGIPFVR